jgi:hypothetical protein
VLDEGGVAALAVNLFKSSANKRADQTLGCDLMRSCHAAGISTTRTSVRGSGTGRPNFLCAST